MEKRLFELERGDVFSVTLLDLANYAVMELDREKEGDV